MTSLLPVSEDKAQEISVPTTERRSGGPTGRRALRRLGKQRSTIIMACYLGLVTLMAIIAPLIAQDPNAGDLFNTNSGPSSAHWLGTDHLGRDELSRILYGARVALLAGVEATGVALLLGLPIGLLLGYFGGVVDRIGGRIVDAMSSIPFLVLAIALIGVLGPGLVKSMFVVGVIYSFIIIRLTRGQVLGEREQLYVDSAQVSGASDTRVIFRHILPNIMPPVIVQSTLLFAGAIIAEASLSFLGLGITPPQSSWGSMLATAQTNMRTNVYLAIPPGVAIFSVVLALNQVGDGIRDIFTREAKQGQLGVTTVERTAANHADVVPDHTRAAAMLSVRGLCATFPSPEGLRVRVVDDISFDIGRAEILALVGESGSGKSVTAMSVLGLLSDPGRASAASIVLDGRELAGLTFDELRRIRGREIGVVFQEPVSCLNPSMPVGDQISEVLRVHLGMSRGDARTRAVELLAQVGLPREELLGYYPHQLSGGMAQRVMIAMALACGPSLLVADEPTTALDVTVQAQVLDLLLELRASHEMSILLITHSLGVVADVADRVAVMYAGQIVETGTTRAVFERPRHPYTRGLLASVPRNEPRAGRLQAIQGTVPSPWSWPTGCRFRTRCDHAEEVCGTSPVPVRAVGDQSDRCVRSDEIIRMLQRRDAGAGSCS